MPPRKRLKTEFDEGMIDGVVKHLAEGKSMTTFASVYGIHRNLWHKIIRENPELKRIRDEYVTEVDRKRRFNNRAYPVK